MQCADKAPGDLVFPGRDGDYLGRPDSLTGWFVAAVKCAAVQSITPHDLRRTCASLAVSAGVNVLALQRTLGHKSAAMTLDTYADLFDTDLDGVADTLHARYSHSNVLTACSRRDPASLGNTGSPAVSLVDSVVPSVRFELTLYGF